MKIEKAMFTDSVATQKSLVNIAFFIHENRRLTKCTFCIITQLIV